MRNVYELGGKLYGDLLDAVNAADSLLIEDADSYCRATGARITRAEFSRAPDNLRVYCRVRYSGGADPEDIGHDCLYDYTIVEREVLS